MLLTAGGRHLRKQLTNLSIIVAAVAGLWLFWSQYSSLRALSWWYDNTHRLRTRTSAPKPDYDLTTLGWQGARAQVFELTQGTLTLVTGAEPFAYQAYATVPTNGANAADIEVEAEIESGGMTIGLMQGGKWIASSSSQAKGPFSDGNSARLGYRRSVTIVIANDNPAGESRLKVKSLRLFLRK